MIFKNKKNVKVRLLIFNLILFLLIVYFIFHSLNGDRGLYAFIKLKKNLVTQTLILEDLKTQSMELENTVKGLNPKTLDRDMLDEVVRRELGLMEPEEILIVYNNTKKEN